VLAVVPVAGSVGGELMVGGRPPLRWTLSALAAVERLVEIVLVSEAPLHLDGADLVRQVVVQPGTGRVEAIRSALAAAGPAARVVIHEADRPLTTPGGIELVLRAAEGVPAAVAAMPVRNTLKRVVEGRVECTVPRERLHQVQTPAVFDRALLEEALDRCQREAWGCADELAVAVRARIAVKLVPGDPRNIPVSAPDSVPYAELLLSLGPGSVEARLASSSERHP